MQLQHDPVAVIQGAIRAADDGDVTGMVSFFADKAVIKLDPPLPPPFQSEYRSRGEIRQYVSQLVNHGFHVTPSNFQVEGDKVRWHATITGGPYGEEGIPAVETDSEAVVRGGLIEWLKVHYDPQSVQAIQAAMRQAQQPQ